MRLVMTGLLCLGLVACGGDDKDSRKVTLPSGVAYLDLRIGSGPAAKEGDIVEAHATGTLTDGTKFWSSLDTGRSYHFHLGKGAVVHDGERVRGVIRGWIEGVPGMMPGGHRKIWVPAALGYGAGERPKIPPNSDLVFEVRLVAVK